MKHVSVIILILCSFLVFEQQSFGQNINLDSMRTARKLEMDSMRAVQKHRSDSLKALREYRASDIYKDSIATIRQIRVDSIRSVQKQTMDSIKMERQRVSDSMMTERRLRNEALKRQLDSTRNAQKEILEQQRAERKKITDSIRAVREYRQSPEYKDSVATARKNRLDSISSVRKAHNDSLKAVRKQSIDSMKMEQEKANQIMRASLDSMRTVRQNYMDSMATVRQIRKDSLAVIRAEREAKRELLKEEKEEKKKLAFEFKIQKKKDDYTNEDMRKKKWSLPRRFLQNTFTRYNYFFNTNEKMKEAVQNMIRSKRDNYDSLISLFPFNPDVDAAKLSSDMDSIIQKASVGIQIHDPRAKWQDDLYLLVGQAYYYKGDYENAGSAFKHIIVQAEEDKKEKLKNKKQKDENPTSFSEEEKTGIAGLLAHTSVKNEAMLWLSRVLAQDGKEGQAQTLLDMLYNDADFPERLYGRLALEQAFIDLQREDYTGAAKSLENMSEDKEIPRWLRLRSNFLLAQIYQNQGKYEQSNKYYQHTIDLHPDLDMNFYAQKNKAFNLLAGNTNPEEAKHTLLDMAKDGKFKPFLDQIYYALAKTEENKESTDSLIYYLNESIQSSQNNNKQKGFSFASLGDAHYRDLAYIKSKMAYDSASMFLTVEEDPTYSMVIQRSQALNEIVSPAELVRHQDSILHLASLPENEQRSIIKDYIKQIEKQINDSIFLSENQLNTPPPMAPQNMAMGGQSWYFSNPTFMQQGLNEFKQKWGNRKLADNWRRSTSSSSTNEFEDYEENEEESIWSNLPNEDSLFAAIPRTQEEIQEEKNNLEQALYLLGKAYYTHLEDYENAIITFDRLDKEFPNHEQQAEILYIRILIAMRKNQNESAQQYHNELNKKFPDSKWTNLLSHTNPNQSSISEERNLEIADFYDETYQLLDKGEHPQVLNRILDAEKLYPNKGAYEKNFILMKAIALVGVKEYENASVIVEDFLQQYPEDTLKPWALSVKNFIDNNQTEMDSRINNTSNFPQNPQSLPKEFEAKPQSKHFVILLAPADNRIFALRAGFIDYNSMKPGLSEITVTMTPFLPQQNMIVFKDFEHSNIAKSYLRGLQSNKTLFAEYPQKDYEIYLISEENFSKLQQDKDLDTYIRFYKNNYR